MSLFDTLQLEGPLARFTLRAWTAAAVEPPAERVHCHDVDQTLVLLRGIVDSHSLRRLASFAIGLGVHAHGSDATELLRLVARRIVSGELVLTREAIEPMASDSLDFPEPVDAYDHELDEGIELDDGIGPAAVPGVEQGAARLTLTRQARQAAALRSAALTGVPFCEICECGS